MIKTTKSGIPGFDELTSTDEFPGGIPLSRTTLIYGPPKTGKTIFANQFTYDGLENKLPCLYITADQGIKQLTMSMMEFNWFLQSYIESGDIYIIDGISQLGGVKLDDSVNYKTTTIGNPAELMIKVGIGSRYVYRKCPDFRSVLDSTTTMFAFNPEQMVLRVLNAYIRRNNEAGGAGLMTYTEGSTTDKTEQQLLSLFDNLIRMDGDTITIKSEYNQSENPDNFKSVYSIGEKGIVVDH
ncbi:MAG: RAD55 family ATPase [Methanobacterium sp. ERen5]|nr:MAG: RAD55 family ATPase [Methanobacterium sp. ERen5]